MQNDKNGRFAYHELSLAGSYHSYQLKFDRNLWTAALPFGKSFSALSASDSTNAHAMGCSKSLLTSERISEIQGTGPTSSTFQLNELVIFEDCMKRTRHSELVTANNHKTEIRPNGSKWKGFSKSINSILRIMRLEFMMDGLRWPIITDMFQHSFEGLWHADSFAL